MLKTRSLIYLIFWFYLSICDLKKKSTFYWSWMQRAQWFKSSCEAGPMFPLFVIMEPVK